MKFKIIFIAIISINVQSCIVDGNTTTETVLINTSKVSVEIIPLKNDMVYEPMKVILNPLQSKTVYIDQGKGKSKLFFTYPLEHSITSDSLLIVFNGIDTLVCKKHTADILTYNDISFDDKRNLYNKSNYFYHLIKESKHGISNRYYVTFTNDDYEFAKSLNK